MDCKSLECESKMVEVYKEDTSLGLCVKRAYEYHLPGSHDPSDMVIRCSQPKHAERYDKGRYIRLH